MRELSHAIFYENKNDLDDLITAKARELKVPKDVARARITTYERHNYVRKYTRKEEDIKTRFKAALTKLIGEHGRDGDGVPLLESEKMYCAFCNHCSCVP